MMVQDGSRRCRCKVRHYSHDLQCAVTSHVRVLARARLGDREPIETALTDPSRFCVT
jgi:hypothetical protein